MSKIFKATNASAYVNEGVYTMYRLAGKNLGAKNFTTVMYDYAPNWSTKRRHTHDARESIYIILEGLAKVHLNGEDHELGPGARAYVWALNKKVSYPDGRKH